MLEFLDRFKNDKICLEYLAKKRWKGKVVCPYCEADSIYHFKDKITYKCSKCRRNFTARIGTIFHGSHVPLRKWFVAIYYLTCHKKGISSMQLHRDISVTQSTAWRMLHKIRSILGNENPLENTVEIDESYFGGKQKNMHWDKKTKGCQGRSNVKAAVLGMLERGGKVKAVHVPNVQLRTVKVVVSKYVKFGSRIRTDEYQIYSKLTGYDHRTCNHSRKKYVNADAHTNGIENFWSLAKRSILGIYHQVSRKYLANYLDEFCFRYNSRHLTEMDRIAHLFQRSGTWAN